MDERWGRWREVRSGLALGAASVLSYGYIVTESPKMLVVVAALLLLVLGYLCWEWRAVKRGNRAAAEEQRTRRQALGIPEWKPDEDT